MYAWHFQLELHTGMIYLWTTDGLLSRRGFQMGLKQLYCFQTE